VSSLFLNLLLTSITVLVKIGGAGHHLVTLPPSTIKNSLKLSVALAIVCPLTASLSKIGVLCLFYHIFGRSGRWYRSAIRTTFGLVLGIMIAQVLIPFVNCRPFSKTWNPHTPGHCTVTGLSLWRYLSIPNVVTTALVVAIPVPALAKLQVSRLITLTLTAVLFASVLGIVAAVMRLQAFLEITNFDDITYENVKPFCWTVVESGIYLITGIMPMLKPLVRRMLGEATLDRLLTKGSRGWGTKSFQKRWYRRGPLATRATTDKQESSSDVWMEEIVLARPQLPRTFKGEVMWV
jgi:hypothetical protein